MTLLCIGAGEVPGGIQLSLFDVGGDEVHRQQVHDDVLGLRLRMALGSMVPSVLSVLRDDVRVHVFRLKCKDWLEKNQRRQVSC